MRSTETYAGRRLESVNLCNGLRSPIIYGQVPDERNFLLRLSQDMKSRFEVNYNFRRSVTAVYRT